MPSVLLASQVLFVEGCFREHAACCANRGICKHRDYNAIAADFNPIEGCGAFWRKTAA